MERLYQPIQTETMVCFNLRTLFRGTILSILILRSVLVAQDVERTVSTDKDAIILRGAAIYAKQCASCHGTSGEGVSGSYPDALIGDSTVGELTKIINDTMPEGEPQLCIGEDANAVAAYIHDAFYSPEAQTRRNPRKPGFSRLTGNQLRQSLADLYARHAGIAESQAKRGVKALYFDGDRFKNENKKIERIDKSIDFDFGKESPGDGIKPESFYIYWEGSLMVEQTGRYELIVRSTCSFKMDFGKIDRMLIDNHVQSGDKTEFRESLYLTAGRVYPFKIDFIQRKRKTELPPAKVSLSWVPPGGVEQVIPERNLIPFAGPSTFSLQSFVPPDDRSYGFDRGVAINKQWDESTTAAAVEFSAMVAKEVWPRWIKKHKDEPNENRSQLKAFLRECLQTAFRGPLDSDLANVYIDRQVDKAEDDSEAIRRVMLLGLKSPRFLYPLADSDKSISQRVANRLALTLTDGLPSDEWLLRRIEKNQLTTESQIREAATRLVRDYRGEAKIREFLYEWLNLAHLTDITKSQELFPGYDAELISDLKSSLNAFLNSVVLDEKSDFRQLFLADWTYTTKRMSEFYGESWRPAEEPTTGLQKSVSHATRHGILTHPFLMSRLAYHETTSPIHRGIFLIKFMLGRTLRPPNDAFSPLSPDLHPDLTTRERVALQTSSDNCQACHSKINALGFVMENYDAVGRFRDTEREKPIDSSGNYRSRDDKLVQFKNAAELAEFLAHSPDSHRAFVQRAFQHFVKQTPDAFGPDTLRMLTEKFDKSGYNVRELLIEIAVVASLSVVDPPSSTTSGTAQ